jgi:hypothetical protein
MYRASLSTIDVIEQVKEAVIDMHSQGFITGSMKNRSMGDLRLIDAINKADIRVCSYLRPEAQIIANLPAGASELVLYSESNDSFSSPELNEKIDTVTDKGENITVSLMLLENESYLDGSNIRGTIISVYSKFPTGIRSPFMRLALQELTDFERPEKGYDSVSYGQMGGVYFEPTSKRFRFSRTFTEDKFISWPAFIQPAKIDMSAIEPELYRIRTPDYAEEFLVVKALSNLMPIGSKASSLIKQELQHAQNNALYAKPQQSSVIQVDGYIG